MLSLTISARNNETFDAGLVLTTQAALYPLLDSGTVVRAQMRDYAESPLVRFEWSTTNGLLVLTPTAAVGWITFTAQPVAGATVTIEDVVFTFIASGATGSQVNLGTTLAVTVANLTTVLNASTDAGVARSTYTASPANAPGHPRLYMQADATGPADNGLTLATNVAGAQASGTTLSGGGVRMDLTAPLSAISRFLGAYVFDVRVEWGAERDVIADGTITFVSGKTKD